MRDTPAGAVPARAAGAADDTFGSVRRIALCLVAAVATASCAGAPGVVSVRADRAVPVEDEPETKEEYYYSEKAIYPCH